jgi:hypothetical protein
VCTIFPSAAPSLPIDELDNLRLEVPGCDQLLDVQYHVETEGGVELGFALAGMSGLDGDRDSEWRRELVKALENVSIFWGNTRETKLATVPCVRGSENA